MGVEELINSGNFFIEHSSSIRVVAWMLIVIFAILFLFIFFKKRYWLTSRKIIIGMIILGSLTSLGIIFIVSGFFGLSLSFSNLASIFAILLGAGIYRYFFWKKVTKPFYENPRKHAYHNGDLKWIIIMIIAILIIFLIAAIMFDFF